MADRHGEPRDPPQPGDEPRDHAGLGETMKAVAASFFGVRGGNAHERDLARLRPGTVILVGIALAVTFVLVLVAIVNMVVG